VTSAIHTQPQLAAIVLAEELHYGRAAKRLHVAISTLSKQITRLEDKLGMTLFVRDVKHVELTDAGKAYMEQIRTSLLQAEKAIPAARAVNEKQGHILTIGHTPYADPNLIRMLLTISVPLYPDVKVQLHSDFAFDLVQALVAGELDVALVAWPPENTTLKFIEIIKAPLYVVLPEYHPASEQDDISLSDLANDHWIILNKRVHPLLYDTIFKQANAYSIKPKEIHHIVTPEEGVHLVLEDAGVAFLPKPVALSSQRLGIVVKPLAEDKLQIVTYLALRANDSSPMVSEFAQEFLHKCVPLVHAEPRRY
jgi:DNA-binding transcriptional LysR family regulator